ncbi:hypothetical protein WJX81_007384 [Elliptochloris bilobata]|uniref:Uncharacterized protein n=1 Tax=Elliptochloris bilobata TaxID=381761 RepID=A0AAW1SM64_9CHLO
MVSKLERAASLAETSGSSVSRSGSAQSQTARQAGGQARAPAALLHAAGLGAGAEPGPVVVAGVSATRAACGGAAAAGMPVEAQLAALRGALDEKQREVAAGRADLERRQALLRSAAGSARREVLELRAQRAAAATALAFADGRLAGLVVELGALASKVSELEAGSGQAPVSHELEQLESELASEAAARRQAGERVAELEAELAARHCEHDAMVDSAAKAVLRIHALEGEAAALSSQAVAGGAAAAAAEADAAAARARCADLQRSLNTAHSEIAATPEKLRSAEATAAAAAGATAAGERAELEAALVEMGRWAEGEKAANQALWGSLQEANRRASTAAADAAAAAREHEAEAYGRQVAEGRALGLAASLADSGRHLAAARDALQGHMVLALAANAALHAKAEASGSSRRELRAAAGALAGELLAVEAGLGALAAGQPLHGQQGAAGWSSRAHARWAAPRAGGDQVSPEGRSVQAAGGCESAVEDGDECERRSTCSSISLSHGVGAAEGWGDPAADAPHLAPRLPAAVSARRWLHGQLTPPRAPGAAAALAALHPHSPPVTDASEEASSAASMVARELRASPQRRRRRLLRRVAGALAVRAGLDCCFGHEGI